MPPGHQHPAVKQGALMPHHQLILPDTEEEPSASGKELVSQLPEEEKDS